MKISNWIGSLLVFSFLTSAGAFAFSDLILMQGKQGERILFVGDFHLKTNDFETWNRLHTKEFFSSIESLSRVIKRTSLEEKQSVCVYECPERAMQHVDLATTMKPFAEKQLQNDQSQITRFEAYEPRGLISDVVNGYLDDIERLANEHFKGIPACTEAKKWQAIQNVYNKGTRKKKLWQEHAVSVKSFLEDYDRRFSDISKSRDDHKILSEEHQAHLADLESQIKASFETLKSELQLLGFEANSNALLIDVIFKMLRKKGHGDVFDLFLTNLDYRYADYFFLKKILLSFHQAPGTPLIYVLGKKHVEFLEIRFQGLGFEVITDVRSEVIGENQWRFNAKAVHDGIYGSLMQLHTGLSVEQIMDQGQANTSVDVQSDAVEPSAKNPKSCAICNKSSNAICSRCESVGYCSTECQKKDWPKHKVNCKSRK